MKCKYCEHTVPDKKWITKNGCIWCDISVHRTPKQEQRLINICKKLQANLKKELKKSNNSDKKLYSEILYAINKNRGKPKFIKKTIEEIRELLK